MNKELSANIDIKKIKWLAVFLLIMLCTFSAGLAFSEDNIDAGSADGNIGRFIAINGNATLTRDGMNVDIKEGESFKLYDIAETDIDSETDITIHDDSLIVVGGSLKSKLELKEYSQDSERKGETYYSAPYGEIRVMSCDDRFNIETPFTDISAYGALDFEVWERQIGAETCVAVFKGEVELENIDKSIKGSVKVTALKMSCVTAGSVPSEPVSIPDDLLKVLRSKGDRFFGDNICEDECGECERLNSAGVCIPDNHKICDDGDECTSNDRCLGRVCTGQRDPSTTNPNCS